MNNFRHFGKEAISNALQLSLEDPKIHVLWLKLYKVIIVHYTLYILFISGQEFIEAIDAIDNGISQYPADIKARYRSRTDLSSRVGALNPPWNQPADSKTLDVHRNLTRNQPR